MVDGETSVSRESLWHQRARLPDGDTWDRVENKAAYSRVWQAHGPLCLCKRKEGEINQKSLSIKFTPWRLSLSLSDSPFTYQLSTRQGIVAHGWAGEPSEECLIRNTRVLHSSLYLKDDKCNTAKYLSNYHEHSFANGWLKKYSYNSLVLISANYILFKSKDISSMYPFTMILLIIYYMESIMLMAVLKSLFFFF